MDHQKPVFKNGSTFVNMKRSPSELAQQLFASEEFKKIAQQKDETFGGSDHHGFFDMEGHNNHMNFPYKSLETVKGLFCPVNMYPNQSSISATIDSQSSLCVDSPISANNKPFGQDNQAIEASSGSSREQSDEDDIEIETGSCEQSSNPKDVRRIKRMVSNRESARRSRKKKQAHLSDLEKQVEKLQGENSLLFKQLSDATHQFKDATTNNRVLKSDVEALRAKVKLADDLVARGSLTSSLSHLLQNYLSTSQDYTTNNTSHMNNYISPMMAYSPIRVENSETFDGNVTNGGADWPWDIAHVSPASKSTR